MDTENNYNYEEDEDNLYEKLQKENEEYVKIFESDLLEKVFLQKRSTDISVILISI